MNWDNELSSILSVAEGSVAKMRERLTSPGKFARGTEPSSSLSPGVQWADLASIQSQLQLQSQEVHMLRERERERERRHESSWGQTSGVERRMEQWKREIACELSTLRGHITRATSLGNLEESFSSKLCREELDRLRREVDLLNTRLRQEEDVLLQQAEARETRRRYEHSYKLEELTDNYRTHSTELAKTVSQYLYTKEEVRQIVVRAEEVDSDSEDFSPTPSLAEVSSDDLSWLD
uniref:Uncharacterized protein n=1 Tax=Mola mola TaxID=94237 RepID=A0A3Q3W1Z6_MOLML